MIKYKVTLVVIAEYPVEDIGELKSHDEYANDLIEYIATGIQDAGGQALVHLITEPEMEVET